jgi:hypothetical protein
MLKVVQRVVLAILCIGLVSSSVSLAASDSTGPSGCGSKYRPCY